MSDIDIEDLLALPVEPSTKPQFLRIGGKLSPEEVEYARSQLLERLGHGVDRLPTILADLNITRRLVRLWVKADAKFAAALAESQELHNLAMEDQLLTLHERHESPQMAKVEADNIRTVLGWRDRQRYGTKVEVTDSANAGLAEALRAAIDRIPRPSVDITPLQRPQTLDLKPIPKAIPDDR